MPSFKIIGLMVLEKIFKNLFLPFIIYQVMKYRKILINIFLYFITWYIKKGKINTIICIFEKVIFSLVKKAYILYFHRVKI